MTLSEVREGLPFQLISRHEKSHQDGKRDFADLTRPAQLNVLADHRATAGLYELHAARQNPEFYPLPACRGYLCDASGYIISREIRTLRTELLEYELRAYHPKRNDWSDDVYDSVSWRAYGSPIAGLTDSLRTFVVKLSHSWLPIGVRERRCSATTDLCPQCNERNRDRSPSVPLPGPGTVAPSVSDPPTRSLERARHCSGHPLHNHQGY
jgi:hypothetical protein